MKFVFCVCAALAIAYAIDMDCDVSEEEGPIFFPHETNCSLFYECAHGEPVLMECWPGLHFNPEINVCDFPENVDCETTGTEKPPGTEDPVTEDPVTEEPPVTEPPVVTDPPVSPEPTEEREAEDRHHKNY